VAALIAPSLQRFLCHLQDVPSNLSLGYCGIYAFPRNTHLQISLADLVMEKLDTLHEPVL
jgi:hypothetical protein